MISDRKLTLAAPPIRCSLGTEIARGDFSLNTLIHLLGVGDFVNRAHRILIGIDSPFGYPREFVEEVSSDGNRTVSFDLAGGFINNPLAYRMTDRVVFREAGKRPLSASLDSLTNNVTKTRAGLALLRRDARILPFERDDAKVAVLEVYPALWKTGPNSSNSVIGSLLAELAGNVGPDEIDAVLCALTVACYEQTVGRADLGLPEVTLPPAYDDRVRTEGWIYFPTDSRAR